MNITSAKYIQAPTTEGGTPVNRSILAVIDDLKYLIPMKEANRYYLAVLEWVAEGNTIEAAD
jgi:hypothetical protein